ncbi:MAG: hypothetical protein ACYC26_06150 [Phycisphaerales bacterium]
MKANVVTNVLLGGLIVLLIVCTAVIQQEIKESRAVMKQLLDKQPDATLVQNIEKKPTPEAMSDERRAMSSPVSQSEIGNQKSETPPPPPPESPPPPPPEVKPSEPPEVKPPESTQAPAVPAAETPKPAPADEAHQRQWAQCGEQVTGIIRDLLSGRYDAVVQQFNADMKAALPKAQLATVMDMARESHGGLDHVAKHESLNAPLPPGMHAFVVTAATEKSNPLVFTITLDDKGKIAGLYLR